MIENIAGHDAAHVRGPCLLVELMDAQMIVRPPPQGERHMRLRPKAGSHPREPVSVGWVRHVGDEHAHQPLAPARDILPAERAGALPRPPLADREQPGEAAPCRAIARIDQDLAGIVEDQPATRDQPNAGRLGCLPGAHHAGDRIAVDDAQRRQAQQCGRREQLLAGRDAAQEGEMRRNLKLDIARGHGDDPCGPSGRPCL